MGRKDQSRNRGKSGATTTHPLLPTASLTCSPPNRFWFRLYWFPLKVLYATCHCSLRSVPDIPFYFFFNALLLLLTVMNLYWFLVSRLPFLPQLAVLPPPGPGSRCRPFSGTPGAGHVRPLERPAVPRARGRSAWPSEGQRFSHLCLPLPQYIVAFAAKVLTGQVQELKDVREYDAAEAPSPKPSKAE